jgi:hypothetical protein
LRQLDRLQARAPGHFAPVAARADILIERGHAAQAQDLLRRWIERPDANARDADLLRVLDRARLATGTAPLRAPAATSSGSWPAPAFRPFGAEAAGRAAQAGNGVIVDGGARILTLQSVARRGGGRFAVRNGRGEIRIARRPESGSSGELARLVLVEHFPQEWSLQPERIAAGEGVRFCFAFGYAVPGGPPSFPAFATGLLLRADAGEHHVMQITSPLTAAHAGSPLFDPYGRLIGLVLGADSRLADGSSLTPQLGKGQYAVPIEGARPVALLKPGERTPPQPQIEQLYEDLAPAIVEIVPLD